MSAEVTAKSEVSTYAKLFDTVRHVLAHTPVRHGEDWEHGLQHVLWECTVPGRSSSGRERMIRIAGSAPLGPLRTVRALTRIALRLEEQGMVTDTLRLPDDPVAAPPGTNDYAERFLDALGDCLVNGLPPMPNDAELPAEQGRIVAKI